MKATAQHRSVDVSTEVFVLCEVFCDESWRVGAFNGCDPLSGLLTVVNVVLDLLKATRLQLVGN